MILFAVVASPEPGIRGRAGVEAARRLGFACLETSEALVRKTPPPPPPPMGDDRGEVGLRGGTRFSPDEPAEPRYPRDSLGRPVPRGGWHWSTANTEGLVAGIVAPHAVAIDVEWLHRPRAGVLDEYFDASELARIHPLDDLPSTLCLWTAKEAVLKLEQKGLAGLPRCRAGGVDEQGRVLIRQEDRTYPVQHVLLGEHLLAIASDEPVEVQLHRLEKVSS